MLVKFSFLFCFLHVFTCVFLSFRTAGATRRTRTGSSRAENQSDLNKKSNLRNKNTHTHTQTHTQSWRPCGEREKERSAMPRLLQHMYLIHILPSEPSNRSVLVLGVLSLKAAHTYWRGAGEKTDDQEYAHASERTWEKGKRICDELCLVFSVIPSENTYMLPGPNQHEKRERERTLTASHVRERPPLTASHVRERPPLTADHVRERPPFASNHAVARSVPVPCEGEKKFQPVVKQHEDFVE